MTPSSFLCFSLTLIMILIFMQRALVYLNNFIHSDTNLQVTLKHWNSTFKHLQLMLIVLIDCQNDTMKCKGTKTIFLCWIILLNINLVCNLLLTAALGTCFHKACIPKIFIECLSGNISAASLSNSMKNERALEYVTWLSKKRPELFFLDGNRFRQKHSCLILCFRTCDCVKTYIHNFPIVGK